MSELVKYRCEDTYFLDRDLAYKTALAHNTVELTDGRKLEQFCYYDGAPFQLAPDNLINVPADQFAEYFKNNPQRLPKRIDTTIASTDRMSRDLQNRVSGMMSMLSKFQTTRRD